MDRQLNLNDIARANREENINTARQLILNKEWVPIELMPPLSEGYYLVTLEEYEHPMRARFMPDKQPALERDGGYWSCGMSTLNDYGILAWKPLEERYMLAEYLKKQQENMDKIQKRYRVDEELDITGGTNNEL